MTRVTTAAGRGTSVPGVPLAERRIGLDDLTVTCLSAGDPSAPLALCLHGFPDAAHTWRDLLPRLADAGWFAVAPFLRGYAPSDVPSDGCYQTGALAADANALHDALGGDGRAVVIGHDWGAPAAYGAAGGAPERWRAVVGMAVPPGPALATAFLTNPEQLRRSWYMFFFLHGLADLVVAADDLAFVDRLWSEWSPGFDAGDDLALVKPSLREPANLRAALGSYRATLGDGRRDARYDALQAAAAAVPAQPTLYLHGRTDGCIGVEVAEAARATLGAHVRTRILDGCGHFLHRERPDAVAELVLDFLAEVAPTTPETPT